MVEVQKCYVIVLKGVLRGADDVIRDGRCVLGWGRVG